MLGDKSSPTLEKTNDNITRGLLGELRKSLPPEQNQQNYDVLTLKCLFRDMLKKNSVSGTRK